jgi:alkylation response protein AidB-like acyl-CoA dehydrogenase
MKLLVARRAQEAAETGMLIEGGEGMLAGSGAPGAGEWQQLLLSAQGLRIGGGTDSIQRNAIAERILGLPRERPRTVTSPQETAHPPNPRGT